MSEELKLNENVGAPQTDALAQIASVDPSPEMCIRDRTSGHWDHYRENMFPAMEMEGESYVCLLYTSRCV